MNAGIVINVSHLMEPLMVALKLSIPFNETM
jgi:hypothetical protein